jgi:hypothetical protein
VRCELWFAWAEKSERIAWILRRPRSRHL